MATAKLVVWFFSALICSGYGSKILVITTMPAHSHFTLAFTLANGLATKGHQVTFISPYPQKTPIANLREFSLQELIAPVEEFKKELFAMDQVSPVADKKWVFTIGNFITEKAFQNKDVQKLMHSGEKFDVVILEHFVNDAFIGIGHHFKAPVVLLSPVPAGNTINYIFANPTPSSYVPNIMGRFTKNMNFWERIENLYINTAIDLVREIYFLPKQREIFKRYIKNGVELDDVLYNVSLILTMSHVSLNDAVPHVPSMIEIGGFHVQPPKKLPQDVQQFLDGAPEGVVLFSMGSNLKSKDLKPEVRKALLGAFGKIKQKVLWKFETDLPEAPKNVKIMKWLPQQDILAHPNVHCFITHGGLLGLTEAIYHGVPVIGIPVFGDQKGNIGAAVNGEYGVGVPLLEITEERFLWALREILGNPKYRRNAQARSRVMQDQPLKPMDSAIFWIEHVIRHKGAPLFRAAGNDLKWYQRTMIDIILFLTLSVLLLSVLLYMIVKKLLGFLFCNQKKIVSTNKKNK